MILQQMREALTVAEQNYDVAMDSANIALAVKLLEEIESLRADLALLLS